MRDGRIKLILLIAVIGVSHICVPSFFAQGAGQATPTPAAQATPERMPEIEKLWQEGIELVKKGGEASIRAAIKKFEAAAQIAREDNIRYSHAVLLKAIGQMYYRLDMRQRALEYYASARDIARGEDRTLEADILRDAASTFGEIGDFSNAIRLLLREYEIRLELKDAQGQTAALHNLAMTANDIGDMDRAKEIYEPLIAWLRKAEKPDHRAIAAAVNNLGYVHYRLGEYQKAFDMYKETYQIGTEHSYDDVKAAAVIGMGDAALKLGDAANALKYYQEGLDRSQKLNNRIYIGDAHYGLGAVFQKTGDKALARDHYNLALAAQETAGAPDYAAKTLSALMSVWNELGNPQMAIFYGKKAVNLSQQLRLMMSDLNAALQQHYLKLKEQTYRDLSNILIAQGRLPEAQSVLDLLKEKEYESLTKHRSGEKPETVPYNAAETEVVAKIERLATLTRRQTELEQLRTEKGNLSEEESAELTKVLSDIEAANRAFRLAVDALSKSESSVNEKISEIKTEKNLQRALAELRRELKTGVVALYTVIGTEEVQQSSGSSAIKFGWIIMVTPEGRKAYPIDVAGLEENVHLFRTALSSAHYDPRPAAEKLYNALFRQTSPKQKLTLEHDLNEVLARYKDKTVMWSLDGVLRYVPVAALHDGKHYLVEKFRNTVFTRQSLMLLGEKDSPKWETLGLGVSEAKTVDDQTFSALDGTKRELEDIVRQPNEKTGILDGTRKLNKEFTKDATINLLREGRYQAVHVASHFSFNPVDQNASFLVIGDGKLTFADIQDKDNLLGSVDLLTLSACDTGMSSNGKESEGFPFLAQSLGAKTVIASLWKVSDQGTPELMIRFYKLRADNPSMPKGEAFRQAQLSLLTGTAGRGAKVMTDRSKRSDPITLDDGSAEMPPYAIDPEKPFAHPHYWASFVLIGNWR